MAVITNSTPHDLACLMRRAQEGDQVAYAALFVAIIPLLRAYVTRRLGRRADQEDVVQTILLSLHRASRTYDSQRSFTMWMFAIARHCLNDHLRQLYRKGGRASVSLDDLPFEISAVEDPDGHERRDYLNALLDALPERQRRIVTMMKIEGHSADDTARALHMKPSAVRVAAHRAHKAMMAAADRLEGKDVHEHG